MIFFCLAGLLAGADLASWGAANTVDVKAMLDGYYERLSAPQHLRFQDLGAWQQRRPIVRQHTMKSLGLDPLPERLPLDTHYGGALDHPDYLLRRVYFQTWPGFYASGWLYLPKSPGRHPAILNPHGHWTIGARHPIVQSRCISLAKKGYVALSVDTVHLPAESFLIGASSIGVMTFNNIRGLDFLESLPEVDAARLGCTGESGGGQQTMYLMLADDRIKAAVPAVLVSYFRRIMDPNGFPHCICNLVPNLLHDTDEPEISATFAPKPALYLSVTGDWTRTFPKEEFPEIRGIYQLYGAEARTGVFQWQSGHDYSQPMREKMYAFFNHWLQDNDDPALAAESAVTPETVEALNALDHPPSEARNLASILEWYRAKYSAQNSPPRDGPALDALRPSIRAGLAALIGDNTVQGPLVNPAKPVALEGMPGWQLRVASEQGIEIPLLVIGPSQSISGDSILLIHPAGQQGALQDYGALIHSLQSARIPILIPDLRLTGLLKRNWELDALLWGRPEVGMAITDLRACLDAVGLNAARGRRVVAVGLKESGITAVMAALAEPRISAVVADRLGATYHAGRSRPLIANILRVGDIPELAAALAPRSCLLAGVTPAHFSFTRSAYQALQADSLLTLRESPLPASEMGPSIHSLFENLKK